MNGLGVLRLAVGLRIQLEARGSFCLYQERACLVA